MVYPRVRLRWVCALILCASAASVSHAQTFQLGGNWVCNLGRVRLIPPVTPGNRKITIEQVGPRLTLIDETGQSSSGQFADVDEIAAPGWSYGERGYVGIGVDGTFYRYKDAVQRFKVPEGNTWNFIRWDSGHVCVALTTPVAARATDIRELTMHSSLMAAMQDAIEQAAAPSRSTFYPVALWEDNALGRGSALLTFKRQTPEHGECLEFAISYYTRDEAALYSDTSRALCRKRPGDAYEVHPDVAVSVTDARRNRARTFLPPGNLSAGQAWKVANTEKLIAHSANAAMVLALNTPPATLPTTVLWEAVANRGAVHVYGEGKSGCLKVVSKPEIPPTKGATYAAEFCRPPAGQAAIGAGWQRTALKWPPPAEKAAAEQQINSALHRASAEKAWNGVTDGVAVSVASAGPPAAEPPSPASAAPTPTSAAIPVTRTQEQGQAQLQSLARVPEIKISDTCSASPSLAPWGGGTSTGGAMPKLAAYREAVSHALRNLKILYAPLTAEQAAGIDRLWAPFFDFPSASTHGWFTTMNPLLDGYLAGLSELDAVYPEYRDAMADVLVASATASQNFFEVYAPRAQALALRLEAIETRLKQIAGQMTAAGDAPNPLAGKCAAQARHRKAIGGGTDVWALLRRSSFVVAADGQKSQLPDSNLRNAGDSGITAPAFMGYEDETPLSAQLAYNTPVSTLRWNGHRFSYNSKSREFDSPCTEYARGLTTQSSSTLQGELSADGTRIVTLSGSRTDRFCDNPKDGTFKETREEVALPKTGATLYQGKPTINEADRAEVIYTSAGLKLPADLDKWEAKEGDVFVRFATFLSTRRPMNMCGAVVKSVFRAVVKNDTCGARYAAWLAGRPAGTSSAQPAATAAAQQAAAGPQDAAAAATLKAAEEAQVLEEAIGHHEALAAQTQQNAARWADDARREKDPVRKEKLEKLALELNANAQAERDIAASLRTGSLVKTRTEWDQRQSDAVVTQIRGELTQFADDDKRMERIFKYLVADHGFSSSGFQQRISDALASSNRSQELAKLEGEVYTAVRAKKAEELNIRVREREIAEFELQRPIELAKQAVNAAVTLTAMAVPGAGPLVIGYGLGMGYLEGGPSGLAKGALAMYSPYLDVGLASLDGAQRDGFWGALKGGGSAALMNKFISGVTPRMQKAMGNVPNVPTVPAARRPTVEVEIHSAEQRMKFALDNAKTPAEVQAVKKQYETIELRNAMKQERLQAEMNADAIAAKARKPDGTVDTNHPEYKRATEELNRDLATIDRKYSAQENRDMLHGEALEAGGLTENMIKLSGGKPKSAMSDMDVTASSYDAGKKYVSALTGKGLSAVEYGDRWVLSNDTTVWKPTASAKAGSSAFEAEVAFGASKGSDKFATVSGQKTTKGEKSGDKLGYVIDNIKKAGEAGLGNAGPKDLHVIGKSADKVMESMGSQVEPGLRKQIAGLRNHQPPSALGITTLGTSPAVKARQLQQFQSRTQAELTKAFKGAEQQSAQYQDSLVSARDAARQRGDLKEVARIQEELALVRTSNQVARARVADVAPGVISPADVQAGKADAGTGSWVPVSVLFDRDRQLAGKVELATKANDPALGNLGLRCKEGAKLVDERLKSLKADSEERRYLTRLKASLDRGAGNPADAISEVRALSGYELAVVLKQLGVASGKL